MGCASSSETKTDYVTGQQTTKHKLGGSYPGNRRQAHSPYTPPASQGHFVSYGGGNALVLKQGGLAQPQIGAAIAKPPEYIQITLPEGVKSGQKIQVAAPDGRLNEIIIPEGFGPGSTFTVEFADSDPSPSRTNKSESYGYAPTTAATSTTPPPQSAANDVDDGFASGFGNSNVVPQASTVGSGSYSAYPSATDAKPVYSSAYATPY